MTAPRFKVGDKVRRIHYDNSPGGHRVGDVDIVASVANALPGGLGQSLSFVVGLGVGNGVHYELVVEDVSEETLRRQVVAWKQSVDLRGTRSLLAPVGADLYNSAVLIEKNDTKPDPAVEALKRFDTDNASVDIVFNSPVGRRSTLQFSDALARQVVEIVDNARKQQ